MKKLGNTEIQLYGIELGPDRWEGFLNYQIHKETGFMKFWDIQVVNENRGNGIILLNHLLNIANREKISIISGDISEKDKVRVPKLKHLYKDFGFEVNLYDDWQERHGKIGKITKRL